MKGWVGLIGWPVADGSPTLVVTHQLQVERRTGKVRQSETDVLPLCYATNIQRHGVDYKAIRLSPETVLSGTLFFWRLGRPSSMSCRLWWFQVVMVLCRQSAFVSYRQDSGSFTRCICRHWALLVDSQHQRQRVQDRPQSHRTLQASPFTRRSARHCYSQHDNDVI